MAENAPVISDDAAAADAPGSPLQALPVSHRRHKIIQRYDHGPVQLREFDTISVDGGAIVEGFNKELTSLLTCSYLIDKLKLPLVGDIISKNFQGYARVDDGFPVHGCRIHGDERCVVFVSEYGIDSPKMQNAICDAIFQFAARHRNSMVITVKGVGSDPTISQKKELSVSFAGPGAGRGGGRGGGGGGTLPPGMLSGTGPTKDEIMELIRARQEFEGKVYYACNDEALGRRVADWGHAPVKEMAVTGISGGILSEAPFVECHVLALFGSIRKELPIVTKTAMLLVECIAKVLEIEIMTDGLASTDRMIEGKIRDLVSSVQSPVSSKAPQPWSGMYM